MRRFQRSAAGLCALLAVSLAGGCAEYGCAWPQDNWRGGNSCGHFECGDPIAGAVVAGFVVIVLIADAVGRACAGAGRCCR